MKTVLTNDPLEAAEFIKRGGIVAFPTETVYGLGANVFDEQAVAKIFEAKRRPADNPLIAHISDIGQITTLATEVTENAEKFIQIFFPGPLTIVLPKFDAVPYIATAGLDTIGVRMPRFELAHRLIAACGVPVVAPSANLSGRPSPTTWHAVAEDLDDRIDCILQGDPTEIGLESTVVDCTGEVPLLLRQGAVSLEQLKAIVPETRPYEATAHEQPKSPGLKHRHYSPTAKVLILDHKFEISNIESGAAYIGVNERGDRFQVTRICRSTDEYAQSVFEFFRECDRKGIKTIYCEMVEETGIGAALMDRLRRAAKG
ncbi:MAG TPA: L-threonylcarbamoyladenylate synthase [Pyrinomonadaceae bacterium]|nr:L-threonylcarbamoyladenylate synthase [Pyrinomonadaceae bacterium]